MTTSVTKILEELADREAIRECLYRYSRGGRSARCGHAPWRLLADGDRQAPGFQGQFEQFIAWAFPIMRAMDQTECT